MSGLHTPTSRRAEVVFAACVIAVAALGYVLLVAGGTMGASADGEVHDIATITRDGEVVETIDLDAVTTPYTIELADARGCNVVAVESGRIRIDEADCPDRICVDTGWIDGSGRPIACVPHGLAITIASDGKGEHHGLDATTR